MARYIDEKDVYRLVEPSGVARVHCSQIDELPRADVAPKSEVESMFNEIEKTIRAILILIDFSYKHNIKEKQCKKECYEDILGYIGELKKKYAEGESNGNITEP